MDIDAPAQAHGDDRVRVRTMVLESVDGIPMACYRHPMANLQVKNVPESLHRKLRAYAKRRGRTVRDVVLETLTREIEQEGFRSRLAQRERVDLGRPVVRTLEEVRAERDRELGG